MTDPKQNVPPAEPRSTGGLFHEPVREARSFPTGAVTIAVGVVVLVLVVLLLAGRHQGGAAGAPDTLRPLAAYAGNLKFAGLAMSESTSLSGGKSTFIDGHVSNAGPATVTGATLQVLFASESGGAPQLETIPLTLVRTRQPYVDTQPVSAAPLAPGTGADFRLIFEGIRPEWNQQVPEIHVVSVESR